MALQRRWNMTDDVWEYSNIGNAIDRTCFLDRNYIYSWLSLNKF